MIAMLMSARPHVEVTWPATVSSDVAPDRPSSQSSWARTRDMRKIAASEADRTKATTMLMSAGRTSCGSTLASGAGTVARREERQQQLALQLEHLALLVRLGVVVAEQVQDAVRRQQEHLLDRGVTRLDRLLRGHRRAQHDVAERALFGLLALAAGP